MLRPHRGPGLLARFTRGLPGLSGPGRGARAGQRGERLRLPPALSAPLGYDAVGVSAGLGLRVRRALPRTGCVFTDAERWWWIVPAQADIGIAWSAVARYSVGAFVTGPGAGHPGPRLTHWPDDDVPYTHPVMLYIALCSAVGIRPDWGDSSPVDVFPVSSR
ncbi:hypothetical protein [Streptomyces carminius]|uniref:hypothetical protein n=1 Tax=Streptomyces carminius TaxID=2665496 RepID=UPI001E56EAC3|nr:hypothetical protein [Streptomyces carminius]